MNLNRKSYSEALNSYGSGSMEDLDHKSPNYFNNNRNSQSHVSEYDKLNGRDSYASPFKMMANQNILLPKSQSFKEMSSPVLGNSNFIKNNGNNNDNIFSFSSAHTQGNQNQNSFRSGSISGGSAAAPDIKELRDFRSQVSLNKNLNQINENKVALLDLSKLQNQQSPQQQARVFTQRQSSSAMDQSLLEYQKYFPHLNYTPHSKGHNESLLKYLTNQESDLLSSLSKIPNNTQQKQLKLNHLQVVSSLLSNLREQESKTLKSQIQVIQDGHVESVNYHQSDGFFVKLHKLERVPNDVDSIQIDYGIFRKGDVLKTYRQTEKIPSVAYNWKFNKCIINFEENFRNVYPTLQTFVYFDVKVFSKNVKEPKSWSWTLHTVFNEDKKLLQGCFKLPLYSKNHIPHAIFQTGFPFMSDSFLYLEVFLKQDYQIGTQIDFDQYVIPKLHLKERQLESIEEDVVVNQFVEEHIKQNGMIKSTFKDDELAMREYNARQKLRIVKKEDSNYVPWIQAETLNNIIDNSNQNQRTSFVRPKTDRVNTDQGDIFDQISKISDKKKNPQQPARIPVSIEEILEQPEIEIQQVPSSREKEEKKREEEEGEDTFIYHSRTNIRKSSDVRELSETSQRLIKKRLERSKDKLDVTHSSAGKNARSSISVTMQKVLDKKNQQGSKQNTEQSNQIQPNNSNTFISRRSLYQQRKQQQQQQEDGGQNNS